MSKKLDMLFDSLAETSITW